MTKLFRLLVLFFIVLNFQSILAQGINDTPFIQEFHVPYPISNNNEANDVRSIAVDKNGNVWAATKAGIYQLINGSKTWQQKMAEPNIGPAFYVTVDSKNNVWVGAWNGIYKSAQNNMEKIGGINQSVSVICESEKEILALGSEAQWSYKNGKWIQKKLPYSRNLREAIPDNKGGYWIATGMGLYHRYNNKIKLFQDEEDLLSADVRDIAFAQGGNLWFGGLGGITIYEGEKKVSQLTSEDGLPSINVNALAQAADGSMWIGTNIGVARYDGKKWSLLHSRRWLLNDEVRDIVFDKNGTAWIATKNGVSAIKNKEMTYTKKAEYFHRVTYKRHVRPPYLVEKCWLSVRGDTTKWEPRDDDNDGEYTATYLVMESFRYAVTKSEEAKQRAKKAFDALQFLQTVTETPGFVARTVIPSDWKRMFDPNRVHTDRMCADIQVRDPRYKPVDKRWRLSKDGKWLWKGDTSSDEITGHMFGYLFYYDMVAKKKEKKRVAQHVCKIVDYIIDCGYVLNDIDGTHTRWGVWSPEKLNNDPDWKAESGINSAEILSYLKLAYHVSGKKKYQKEYLKLLYEHNYADNIKRAKTFNPSWITHIDDELLALVYPCLLLHEKDPKILNLYRESLDRWYRGVKADKSPFFDFTYALLSDFKPDLKRIAEWFKDVPLDLVRWRVDNSKRMDIKIVRSPELESLQTNRMLPLSEISFYRWDRNPWYVIQGDGGVSEGDGVFWLLPYWMGRYLGFIDVKG
jgi:hypothetical protein